MLQFLKVIAAFVVLGVLLYTLFVIGIVVLGLGLALGFIAYAIAFWNTRLRRKRDGSGAEPEGVIDVEFHEVRIDSRTPQ